MAGDFDPIKVVREQTLTEGNRADAQFTPEDGSSMAVAYINPTPGQEAAVNALLADVESKCSVFAKKAWIDIDSEEDKRAMVDVRVIVARDDEV